MKTLRSIAALLVATFVISSASAQDKMKMKDDKMISDTSKMAMKKKMMHNKMMHDTTKMKMHHDKMKMDKMKPEGKM